MFTRRSYLQAIGLAAVTAGCVDRGPDPYDEAVAGIPSDLPDGVRPVPVDGCHWFPGGAFASVADRADAVDLAWERFSDRRSLEVEVANRMVAGRPPDLVQTALGAELGQYVTVAEIDPLRELSVDGPVADLAVIDGHPYAVPVSRMPTNAVALSTDATDDVPARDLTLADLRAGGNLGIRRSPSAVFQLFCVLVLAAAGRSAYRTLGSDELAHATVTEAVGSLDALVADGRWLPRRPAPPDLHTSTSVLVDPVTLRLLHTGRWRLAAFPGTDRTALVHATGLARPSRTREPHGATRALQAATDGPVQHAIAARSGHLPGLASAPAAFAELGDLIKRAGHVLPAASTGCGLDPDRRLRAMRALSPDRRGGSTEALVDRLTAILR